MNAHAYIAELFFLLGGALFLFKALTWDIPKKHARKKVIQAGIIVVTIIGLSMATGLNYYVNRTAPQGSLVFVTPQLYIVRSGMDEEFIIKVTNDHSYPLYKVRIIIKLDSGDFPLFEKDALVIDSGVCIMGAVCIVAIDVKNPHECYKLLLIENMDPHTTKSFPAIVHKSGIITDSKLSFTIMGTCRNPVPRYTEHNELSPGEASRIIIPKAGHYENCN